MEEGQAPGDSQVPGVGAWAAAPLRGRGVGSRSCCRGWGMPGGDGIHSIWSEASNLCPGRPESKSLGVPDLQSCPYREACGPSQEGGSWVAGHPEGAQKPLYPLGPLHGVPGCRGKQALGFRNILFHLVTALIPSSAHCILSDISVSCNGMALYLGGWGHTV